MMPDKHSNSISGIHVGNLVKEELRRQERTVAWFARRISTVRPNVYDIFRRENIDVQLLVRISIVLNHDFLKDISEHVFGTKTDANAPQSNLRDTEK
ncbi:MAG: hypothetical protein ACI3Z5_04145 [Paludibacteraceae bacterium]